MSQLEEAKALIKRMSDAGEDYVENEIAQLRAVLEQAQNAPPQGKADGSIDEVTFNTLRNAERAATKFLHTLHRARRAVRHRASDIEADDA